MTAAGAGFLERFETRMITICSMFVFARRQCVAVRCSVGIHRMKTRRFLAQQNKVTRNAYGCCWSTRRTETRLYLGLPRKVTRNACGCCWRPTQNGRAWSRFVFLRGMIAIICFNIRKPRFARHEVCINFNVSRNWMITITVLYMKFFRIRMCFHA